MSAVSRACEDADYSGAAVVTTTAADEACRQARAFLDAAQALLAQEGWLPR